MFCLYVLFLSYLHVISINISFIYLLLCFILSFIFKILEKILICIAIELNTLIHKKWNRLIILWLVFICIQLFFLDSFFCITNINTIVRVNFSDCFTLALTYHPTCFPPGSLAGGSGFPAGREARVVHSAATPAWCVST